MVTNSSIFTRVKRVICDIFKSLKKDDTYLYLQRPSDFELIPDALSQRLGKLEFVMELELSPDKKLAREEARVVMENITEHGFYLQIPPKLTSLMAVHNPDPG